MKLTELLRPESVLCDVDAGSKKHAIEIISKLLANCDSGLATDEVFASLIERERLGCTAMENGIAMPHSRLAGTRAPVGAFIRLANPVDFDMPEENPVDLVFGLIVPDDLGEVETRSFSTIMQRLSGRQLQQELRAAEDHAALFEILAERAIGEPMPEKSTDQVPVVHDESL